MTTLTSLPNEIIENILSYNDISFEDIINFRCVCENFRWAVKTEEYCFLKTKFSQRWSSAKKYYEQSKKNEQKQSKENENGIGNLTSFVETGIDCAKLLRNEDMRIFVQYKLIKCNSTDKILLGINLEKRLSNKCSSKLMFMNRNYIRILFFMDEIKYLLDQPVRANCDLTDRYYYIKLLDSLEICWRNDVLKRYIEQPYKKQPYEELPEKTAFTWAQQLQLGKYISYLSVKASLKNIALEALNFLRKKHPGHSIFSTPDEYFSYWENNNIDDNYWNETEGTQIMDTLQKYMLDKLKFRSACFKELKYFCINYVLKHKHGNRIILYIIYQSVARRLGLRCDLVRSYAQTYFYFELFWMPKYTFPTDYKEDICLLDDERKKNMRCIQVTYCIDPPSAENGYYGFFSQEVYKRTFTEMLKSIINRQSLNHLMISPSEILIHRLKCFIIPQTRPINVKFAVGMIVTHGDESKDCFTGVIIGWLQLGSNFIFHKATIPMTFIPLKMCSYFKAEQTYYIILTKSDELCCVKEDDIALTKPNWIGNRNIYYYFSEFKGTHYVPNEELTKIYPHDAAITAETIFKE